MPTSAACDFGCRIACHSQLTVPPGRQPPTTGPCSQRSTKSDAGRRSRPAGCSVVLLVLGRTAVLLRQDRDPVGDQIDVVAGGAARLVVVLANATSDVHQVALAGGQTLGPANKEIVLPSPDKRICRSFERSVLAVSDTEVCDVTAGARSAATDDAARPRPPEKSRRPQARTRCARRRDLQPIPAIRHNNGSGIIHSVDCLSLGIIPTKAAA